jgi:hypothetical protein
MRYIGMPFRAVYAVLSLAVMGTFSLVLNDKVMLKQVAKDAWDIFWNGMA